MTRLSEEIASIIEKRRKISRCLDKYSDNERTEFDQVLLSYFGELRLTHDVTAVEELLKSFDDSFDDFGTQELVCGVLNQVASNIFVEALMSQFARMIDLAPEWLYIVLVDRQRAGAGDLDEMEPSLKEKCLSLIKRYE